MSIQTHLVALTRQHQVLEQQICAELLHSSCDDLKLAELKRSKLRLKDEIGRLQRAAGKLKSNS